MALSSTSKIMTSLGFNVVNVTLDEVTQDVVEVSFPSIARVGVALAAATCGPLWVRPLNDRLALPFAFAMVAPLRLTAVAARLAVVCPAAAV